MGIGHEKARFYTSIKSFNDEHLRSRSATVPISDDPHTETTHESSTPTQDSIE
jgi:hypothetical protein